MDGTNANQSPVIDKKYQPYHVLRFAAALVVYVKCCFFGSASPNLQNENFWAKDNGRVTDRQLVKKQDAMRKPR